MKKKIAIMLVVLTTVCVQVTGCGQDKKSEDNKKTESIQKKEDRTETKKEEKTEKKKEEKITDVKRGTIADGVYKNETFGVSFAVPANMIVYTDEQIAQSLNLGTDFLTEKTSYSAEDMEKAMQGAMYDAILLFSDNSSNVSVIYEDMDKSQTNEEQYLQAVANSLKSMEGMGYQTEEPTVQKIGETEFAVMTAKTDQFAQKYFLHRVGDYMIEFIFTYTDATQQEVEDFISNIMFENPLS